MNTSIIKNIACTWRSNFEIHTVTKVKKYGTPNLNDYKESIQFRLNN